jgi:hypothetical protein
MSYIEQVKEPARNRYEQCITFARLWVLGNSEPFTSEALKDAFAKLNEELPAEPRVWGAVIRQLQRDGLIAHMGYSTYQNPAGHGRPISIWKVLRNKE